MSYVTYKGQKYHVKDGILNLNNIGIRDITEIERLNKINDLNELILSENQISEIKNLNELINLKYLDLSRNQISEIKGLETLTNLQSLYINRNQISEIKGLERLTNLEYLNIQYNEITEIKGLETLTNLQLLFINNNQISEIKGLERLTNFKYLNIDYNEITEIKGLETLTNLILLVINGNQISEIKGLETLSNLEMLGLHFNKITEIIGLDNLSKLRILSLQENPIKNEEYYLKDKNAQEVVEYCRMKKQKEYEFDFAFSFAGEDRATVKKVRDSLVRKGIRVFFDEDFEWNLIGKNLSNRFKEVYGKNTKYVVIFISKHYKVKYWTDFEFQIAREEANSRKEEFILPIRLDDTILLGIQRDIGYFNYHQKGTREISNLLSKKLEDFNERHNIFLNEYSDEDFTNDSNFDEDETYEEDQIEAELVKEFMISTNFDKGERYEEIQIEKELINSYIDMLEDGKVPPSLVWQICDVINKKCYPIAWVQDLNEEILKTCAKVVSYFCKEMGNVDTKSFKIILECLEGFTRRPVLVEILKKNCDIKKFIALFEGGIIYPKLLSILYEVGFFTDLVFRLKKAFSERDFELVNALTLLVWRKNPKIEKIEILTFFIEKLNDYSPEKDKDIIKFIETLKSNLEFKRDIYKTPDFNALDL